MSLLARPRIKQKPKNSACKRIDPATLPQSQLDDLALRHDDKLRYRSESRFFVKNLL